MLPDISKLKRFVALVIKFDPETGKRPIPGIAPHFAGGHTDRALFCLPLWQDTEKGIEMRLILDDRDIEQYRGIEGVEVIEGKDAINAKVRELFKPRYSVAEPELFRISVDRMLADGRLSEGELKVLSPEERLKLCYERGALGMRKQEPYQIP